MRLTFYIVVLLIAYGSFFPFDFSLDEASPERIQALFDFNILNTDLSNLISNIVLFVPFGVLIRAAYPQCHSKQSLLMFLCVCLLYAFIIQALQIFASGRLPWGGDAVWNLIGCAIGFVAFEAFRFEHYKPLSKLCPEARLSMLIVVALLVLELAPFAPSIDFDVLKDNVKAVVFNPQLDWFWTYENTVFWLVSFYLITNIQPAWNRLLYFSALCASILILKTIVISSDINLSQVVASALALTFWWLLRSRIAAATLAFLVLFAIIGNGLYPFELKTTQSAFHWLPFQGSLNGNALLNIIAAAKKMVFYATLIWLLKLSGITLIKAVISVSILVFLSEYAQSFFTNSVAEITDAILVLIAGVLIYQCLRKFERMASSADAASGEATNTSQANNASLFYTKASAVNKLQIHATQTSTSSYIPALNGLRALAAMSVFLVHFQQFTQFEASFGVVDIKRWMINGNTGVALFFILSGFLLSMPFWHTYKTQTLVSMRDYFINRSIRIIPIYYLCIFALLLIKGFSGPDVNFNNLLSHLFFLHNLKDYQVLSLNPPFWTLAVEFQFYLFLPLFFYALVKLSYRSSQVVCALSIPLIYLAYRLLMSALEHWQDWPIAVPLIWPFGIDITSPDGPALTYSLFAHLPHFLIGVLAASFYRATDSKFAEAAFWLSSVFIFIVLATPLDELMQVDFGRYNFPFIPLLLGIIVFSAPLSRVAGGLLELRLLKWMGIISYGIYLYHYPIQKAVKHGFEAFDLAVNQYAGSFLFGSLVLTLVIAHVSYLLVEQPIMRRFKRRGMSSSAANMGSPSEPTTNLSTIKKSSTVQSNSPLASDSNIPLASNARARKSFYPLRIAMLCSVVVSLSGYFIWKNTENNIVIEQVPWAGSAAPEMIFDHHTHTQYSDGSLSVPDLVEMAFFKGCDAFAITDHNSGGSLSDKKFTEIAKMRDAYPGLLIFAGMELGMPATEGREHVSIITTPRFERALLTTILNRQRESQLLALEQRDRFALDLIDNIPLARGQTIAIYNHPSRKDDSAQENLEDIKNWNQQHRNIVAFAGAPGHQKSETLGSYAHVFKPIERWDPVVAQVGGTWDMLLSEGHRIWGAIASSDYHNDSLDYPPCEFSRIHVKTPSTSYEGLIKGIQAGTFWADHGKLLEQYDFYLQADLKSPAVFAGGEITLNTSAQVVSVNIDLVRGDAHADAFLRFDMISNCSTEQTSLSSQYIPPEENSSTLLLVLPPTPKDCFVRSRIVKETIDGLNLSAYSNPIFISF